MYVVSNLVSQHHLVTIARTIILDVYAFLGTFPSHLSSKESRMSLNGGFHHSELSYLHGRIILWENHYRIFPYLSSSGLGEREEEDSEALMKANYSLRNTTSRETLDR